MKSPKNVLLEIRVEGELYGWEFWCPLCREMHTIGPPSHTLKHPDLTQPSVSSCSHRDGKYNCDLMIYRGYIYYIGSCGWSNRVRLMKVNVPTKKVLQDWPHHQLYHANEVGVVPMLPIRRRPVKLKKNGDVDRRYSLGGTIEFL